MKLIIAGGRNLEIPLKELERFIMDHDISIDDIEEIVSGGCVGMDACGESFAKWCNIPIKTFPAEWEKFGKMAGPIRNRKMAAYADALVLVWDGKSKGSSSMKRCMISRNKSLLELIIS